MPTKFDKILDDCVSRITIHGESVESCLARYPDEASELEPLLRIVAQTDGAYSYTPSSQAKAHGRERLHAEMRSIEAKGAVKSAWNPLQIFSGFQRLAVASAAVLLVATTSISTVAASQSTKPGDFLYPVKRTAENTRLALEFSSESKANLEIEYAERRANEIAKLLESGDTDKVDSAQKDLRNHLASAAKIAGNLEDGESIAKVRTNLVTTSTEALAKLDIVVESSAPQKSDVAVQTSKEAGGSFSDAIDSVPLPESVKAQGESRTTLGAAGPASAPAADTFIEAAGTIQIYVSDLPEKVEQFLIEVTKIEAYLAAGSNSRWVDVTTSPQIIDLSKVSDVRKFLGEGQVQSGTYTRVRLNISSASAVLNGSQREVKVPGASIVLNRPFRVKAGETTVLHLSFDGEKSLRSSQLGELLLVPSVHLSVRNPVVPVKVAQRASDSRASKPIEIEGTISAIQDSQITVLGKPIFIRNNTKIEGRLVLGGKARIKANISADGILIASEIRVSAPDAVVTPFTERPRPTVPVQVPPTATPRPAEVKFGGIIDSLSPGVWLISGKEVIISDRTKIDGTPQVGAEVQIEAQIQSSGSIIATMVFIPALVKPTETPDRRPILELRVTISGALEVIDSTHWLVDSTRVSLTSETVVEGIARSGSKVEVVGVKQLDGTVIALKARISTPVRIEPTITRRAATSTPSAVQLTGVIEKMGERELLVANVHVILTSTTAINGRLTVGAQVKIDGLLLKTGVINATSITVISLPSVAPTLNPTPQRIIPLPTVLPINPLAPIVK